MPRSHNAILWSFAVMPYTDICDILGIVSKIWRVGKKKIRLCCYLQKGKQGHYMRCSLPLLWGKNIKPELLKAVVKMQRKRIIINTRQHISMGKRPCQEDLI